ncbi:hypothetical protein ACFRKD_32160 [Streptomyces niveus]|uniref:hypothetical protein n=1 Tax=Streptomyces niveus TaxID=193462 RepID=UPI0036C6CCB3
MNLNQIPATPVYTLIISSTGVASLDGQEITAPGLTLDEARIAALAELRIKAALFGRPVRVTAKEANGAQWPLIVDQNGIPTTVDHHPAPPPPPPPPPAPPKSPNHPPAEGFTPTMEAPPPTMANEWSEALPPDYQILWEQLGNQERAGALADAIITADHLERVVTQQYGTHHRLTVNMLTLRAWLTLCATTEWAEVIELLVQTARRRQEADAHPQEETARLIRNAHAGWRKLTVDDPEYARELADQVFRLLDTDAARARDVIKWIEGGTASA